MYSRLTTILVMELMALAVILAMTSLTLKTLSYTQSSALQVIKAGQHE